MTAGAIDFFTSKTGVVAAVVVVLGILTALHTLVRPLVDGRRSRRRADRERIEARARLEFSNVDVEPPPPWTRAGIARFEITNAGGRPAILQALHLEVVGHGVCAVPRAVQPGAAVVRHSHRVELVPERERYDIRGRMFGAEASPLSFDEGETEGFDIQLVSAAPHWYEFRFLAEWYDTKDPSEVKATQSAMQRLEFPPDAVESHQRPV